MADKISQHQAALRQWKPSHLPEWLNDEFYVSRIQPALQRVDMKGKQAVADELGMSLCSMYRFASGRKIPHRRHWAKRAELVGVAESTA